MQRLDRDLAVEAHGAPGGADTERARSRRRAQGAYFTPGPLVELVVAETIGAHLRRTRPAWRADGSPELVVLDPAAGDGRFLAACVDYLVDRSAARGYERSAARAAITRRCVIGIERDADFAEIARCALGPGAVIHCREALLDPPPDLGRVDIVVGNPPYLRSIHFARTDAELWEAMRGRYAATSHGEWDLYAAFLEQALAWIRPGGEVGLVVPSRWLTAAFARGLRAKLAEAAAVRGVIDFGAQQLFAGATTYASVAFLSASPTESVAVARFGDGGWQCGSVESAALSDAPWKLSVGGRRALIERLSAAALSLGEIARIAKGAGTNADPVYVLTEARVDGDAVEGLSRALGERVRVEAAMTRVCIRGRDVRPVRGVDTTIRCVTPYRADGAFIEPGELPPLTAAYFERCRERLESRESGKYRGERFYRFGRPQNMAYLFSTEPKIVVPDVAREGRALIDRGGAIALDSAYAIRPLDPAGAYSIDVLAAVLSSPIVGLWLRETGIPLRGGYVRLKTAYLRSLPLPPVDRLDGDLGDDALRAAYQIDAEDWA